MKSFLHHSIALVFITASLYAQAKASASEKPIARVLQQTILASHLEPDESTKKQAKAVLKGQYNQWLTEARYAKMAALIWDSLQQQFFKEKNITASASEVTTFFEYARKARELQKQQLQSSLQQLQEQLQSGKLSAEQQQQAQALKKQVQQALEQLSKPMPEPTQQEREMAQRTIQIWKFDQALYKQYGGTVVMKQANPLEPIGAYKKYLEEHERSKSFEIYDGTYKKNFWKLFDISKEAIVIPPQKVDYSKPWWIFIVEQAQAMKR
ncbi:MAG: hypothetical protein RML40_11045 [Bacteroidota bacterium]|nr:hypothetical protein [Candidatus Kapabacteria bacterium]MDW8221051.1 hypothetical protein [Bacteroidota bacterium]